MHSQKSHQTGRSKIVADIWWQGQFQLNEPYHMSQTLIIETIKVLEKG